ncbi:unnamed protein product [Pleuronectes platessa]|uniref:Uncharacterized protein n=1 Tax=Pleuronectes platessa TaxID=8262 RepID=A0A9N7YLF4_PLEPL|nr:unnamed protein product [Pleuronectes platessa]
MQDLLRQWGNTAELCSLCCQQACKEEEGEREHAGGGGGEAILQSTWPRHGSTSPATKRLRVSAEKFSSSPVGVRCRPRPICSVGAPGCFRLISFSLLCTSNNQAAASQPASQLAFRLRSSLIHVLHMSGRWGSVRPYAGSASSGFTSGNWAKTLKKPALHRQLALCEARVQSIRPPAFASLLTARAGWYSCPAQHLTSMLCTSVIL